MPNEKSKGVCHELYYLSGYIVECFCVYSIYKLHGWEDENVPINDTKSFEYEDFEDKNQVSFFGNQSKAIPRLNAHLYSGYVDILRKRPEFKGIPYFSTSSHFNSPEIYALINSWDPQIRYNYDENDSTLKYVNIKNLKDILDWCELVREHIINNIG